MKENLPVITDIEQVGEEALEELKDGDGGEQ